MVAGRGDVIDNLDALDRVSPCKLFAWLSPSRFAGELWMCIGVNVLDCADGMAD